MWKAAEAAQRVVDAWVARTEPVARPALLEPADDRLARAWGLTPWTAHHLALLLLELPSLRVSGGRRSRLRNFQVGGAPGSFHLTGRAVDLTGPTDALLDGATWARRHGAVEVLVHDAGSGLHLHLAW